MAAGDETCQEKFLLRWRYPVYQGWSSDTDDSTAKKRQRSCKGWIDGSVDGTDVAAIFKYVMDFMVARLPEPSVGVANSSYRSCSSMGPATSRSTVLS